MRRDEASSVASILGGEVYEDGERGDPFHIVIFERDDGTVVTLNQDGVKVYESGRHREPTTTVPFH